MPLSSCIYRHYLASLTQQLYHVEAPNCRATVGISGSTRSLILGGAAVPPLRFRQSTSTASAADGHNRRLCSPQRQQRDLRRHANPYWKAERSEPAVHIERRFLYSITPGCRASMPVHRQPIKPSDKRRNQPSRTNAVIHNLNLHLPAVSVTGQAKLDAKHGRAPKRIRIVRQQNVRHVAPNQRLDLLQHRPSPLAVNHVVALIINAQQIEAPSIVLDNRVSGAQQPHSLFAEEPFRIVFHSRINFVVAIASPNAQRSAQPAQLGNAGVQRIAFARNKVSRNKRNIGLQLVSHVNRASNLARPHVVANVDVAKLSNAQPIQFRRKIGHRHIDALDGIAKSPSGKSISSGKKWKASSKRSRVLKESPPRWTEPACNRSRPKPRRDIRDPLNRSHRFNRQESKE